MHSNKFSDRASLLHAQAWDLSGVDGLQQQKVPLVLRRDLPCITCSSNTAICAKDQTNVTIRAGGDDATAFADHLLASLGAGES